MDKISFLCVAVCAVCILNIHAQRTSPPKITDQSETYLVFIPRDPTEIVCQAVGIPDPEYRWQKDGEDIELGRNYELIGSNLYMRAPGFREEGIYRCFAENQYGAAISSKIEFVMAYTDSFTDEQSVHRFDRGDAASIPCNNKRSVPKPSVFWTDDSNPGQKIVLDNRVSVDTDFNLRFANIKLEDMKNYQCNIKNDLLLVQHLSAIKEVVVADVEEVVPRPATLVAKPSSSVDAFRTQELHLKCMAEGYPTPEITWAKEGEDLPADRTEYESYGQTLVIKGITATDAGTYICTASNGEGEPTQSSTIVIVKALPYWENKPEDLYVVINDPAELVCRIAGVPLPSVSWLINGVPSDEAVPNPRRIITGGAGSGRVSIVDAIPEDSAVFQCVGENEYGEISASGFVSVQLIPADVSDAPPASYITVEGLTIELVCAGLGLPKPVVAWSFKGKKLEAGGRFEIVEDGNSVLTTSSLIITGAEVTDTGVYNCSVRNGFSQVLAYSSVTVRTGTKVIVGPEETITVVEDNDAVISCEVTHDPALPPEVTWTRDIGSGPEELDLEVSGSRFKPERPGSNNLKVLETKVEDTGRYSCKATTSEDMVEDFAELVVQMPPRQDDSEGGDEEDEIGVGSDNHAVPDTGSINDIETARLKVEKTRLDLDRELLLETRSLNRNTATLNSKMERLIVVFGSQQQTNIDC